MINETNIQLTIEYSQKAGKQLITKSFSNLRKVQGKKRSIYNHSKLAASIASATNDKLESWCPCSICEQKRKRTPLPRLSDFGIYPKKDLVNSKMGSCKYQRDSELMEVVTDPYANLVGKETKNV